MTASIVTIQGGSSWQDVAAGRQRHRDSTISAFAPPLPDSVTNEISLNTTGIPQSVLTKEEIGITGMNVEVLAEKIAAGEWTATQVIKAFLRRAALAQKLVNCVTELLPDKAFMRAAELDKYLETNKKPIGPLHGVPISVKEHVGIKGLDLNAGFISWVGRVAEEDALILQCLWDAGAVFYVRTTQPQTLMHLETSSSLYGVTVNPFNRTLTAGGSSGGEGALIGLRGSILGIGTDIGGSIRSPAANNGLFGFKPTSRRLPFSGAFASQAGNENIIPTIGPISTSLEGLRLFTRAVIDRKPWLKEPSLVPIEWREASITHHEGRKLKVGVMLDDGVVRPHPPILRGLTELVEKLKKSDTIKVVDWKPWKHDLAWSIIAGLYFADGAAEDKSIMAESGEPWMPLSRWAILDNPHVREHTMTSLWEAVCERESYRKSYNDLWNETAGEGGTAVDVILCPVGPGVAPKLDTSRYWGYTAQWNLLDYPAAVFPTGQFVDTKRDRERYQYSESYTPMSESDRYNYDLWMEHGAEGYQDAPISLQLVGRRYEDEKLLNALGILLDAAGLSRAC